MNKTQSPIDQHRTAIIGTIAAVHLLLSVALFFLVLASGMSRFDGAGPSDLVDLLLSSAFKALSFPLLMLAFTLPIFKNSGIWGWLPFLANSLLWGWAGWRAIRFWRSRHEARRAGSW